MDGHRDPPRCAVTVSSLRQHYEDPATVVRSGPNEVRRQTHMLLDMIRDVSEVTVVDIGCGDGAAIEAARSACRELRGTELRILGVDWSLRALSEARGRRIASVCSTVEGAGLPIRSKTVQVVVVSEVIEHLTDPDAVLRETRRILAPGGHLLISTPNLAAWFNRVLLLVGVQPIFSEVSLEGIYGRPGREVVGHLRLFTRRALVELLNANGFTNVRVTGAQYSDVPRGLRPLDRVMCHMPGLASILLASAQAPG